MLARSHFGNKAARAIEKDPVNAQAKAAYCERDTMMSYVGDERVIKLGLALVIRSGGREGVLELNPGVLFNYRRVGDHYLPGKVETTDGASN